MRTAKTVSPEIAIGKESDHQFVSSRSRRRRESRIAVEMEASGVPGSEVVSRGTL